MDNLEDLEELKKQISDLQSKLDKIENQKKEEKKGKRWRAKTGNEYFCVEGSYGEVISRNEYNDMSDNYRFKIRDYFKTKEEAEEYQDIINTYYDLMDLAEELNNGEKIDWNDNQQCKYTIFYNFEDNFLKRTNAYGCKEFGQIYCLDGAFLEKAIEKIGKDRLKKLFTYERN